MMTAERTRKIHMLADPTWDPANYEYETDFDAFPEPPTFSSETAHIAYAVGLLEASPTSEYDWNDRAQCDHCGAHIRYTIVMKHIPTGDFIAIGQDCATERFNERDRITYLVKRAAQRRAAAKERAEVDAKLAGFAADHPGVAEFFQEYGEANEAGVRHYSDSFVMDVGRKLVKYGSISDRQISAVGKAFERDGEKEAERFVSDLKPKSPMPSGRQVVTGRIVSQKWVDSDYGSTLKFLVEATEGFRVFGTKPTSLDAAEVGDIVSFTATLKPSHNDEFFGYGSRPTKGFIVKAAT
jgi:hypothetical protein